VQATHQACELAEAAFRPLVVALGQLGAFLQQLRVAFPGDYTVLGLDVSGPALKHAESLGLPVQAAPFDVLELGGPPFDAITFWAVLEHVDQPRAFLRKSAEMLVPGGCAFVLVPNARSLAVHLLGARYRYIMPEHINYFSAATLKALAQEVPQFEIVALRSTHFNPVVLWQDALHPRDDVPTEERARLMTRTNAWKSAPKTFPCKFVP
jgi:SAM-dependent methyltransferase